MSYGLGRTKLDEKESQFFENGIVWLTCLDAAIYLRKFRKDGSPSTGAIRNLIYRGKLKARKFGKVLYLKKSEIDRAIDLSVI